MKFVSRCRIIGILRVILKIISIEKLNYLTEEFGGE